MSGKYDVVVIGAGQRNAGGRTVRNISFGCNI